MKDKIYVKGPLMHECYYYLYKNRLLCPTFTREKESHWGLYVLHSFSLPDLYKDMVRYLIQFFCFVHMFSLLDIKVLIPVELEVNLMCYE